MTTSPAGRMGSASAAEMVSVLRAIYPSFQIIDTSFPLLTFSWAYDDVLAVSGAERFQKPEEQAFYARFRQLGGHLPLLSWPDLASYAAAKPQPGSSAQKTRIIVCHASECAQLVPCLHKASPGVAVLVHDPLSNLDGIAHLAGIGFQSQLSVNFVRPETLETYQLTCREPLGDAAMDRIVALTKTFALDLRIGGPNDAKDGPTFWIDLPADSFRPETASLSPRFLIHDGSRRSERDGSYAWLWLGVERHIRLLLGHVPSHFRSVRVVIPNAFTNANIEGARLLLNGQVAPSRSEIWGEGVGAISTELPPGVFGEQVLGFSVPAAKQLDDGSATLSACIDKIEFRA